MRHWFLGIMHQATATFVVRAEDCSGFMRKTFFSRNGTPFKASNTGTQYVDYSMELKNQIGNRNRFNWWQTGSGQME